MKKWNRKNYDNSKKMWLWTSVQSAQACLKKINDYIHSKSGRSEANRYNKNKYLCFFLQAFEKEFEALDLRKKLGNETVQSEFKSQDRGVKTKNLDEVQIQLNYYKNEAYKTRDGKPIMLPFKEIKEYLNLTDSWVKKYKFSNDQMRIGEYREQEREFDPHCYD